MHGTTVKKKENYACVLLTRTRSHRGPPVHNLGIPGRQTSKCCILVWLDKAPGQKFIQFCLLYFGVKYTRVGTLIVATIYLQLIQN